jgi:hypothetical protein
VNLSITSKDRKLSTTAVTTDLSEYGCYVPMVFTPEVGTELNILIGVNDHRIPADGVIRSRDGGVGIGIEFRAMAAPDRTALKAFLDSLPEDESSGSEPVIIR